MNQKWIVMRVKIREFMNHYLGYFRRKKAGLRGEKPLSIISNNCWAGHVYRYFNLPYSSPTVGLFFFTDEYLRFLSNLEYYLSIDIRFIPLEQSKYKDILEQRNTPKCPIGVLDDVELVFLHYHSEEEAKKKWNRRKRRLDLNNLIVKMSEQNLCTPENLMAFDKLPFNRKFVLVHKDYGLENQVICNEFRDKNEVLNDTDEFRRHIKLISLVKGEDFKK